MARKPSSGPNMALIAKRLGLSLATVSRAIRNAEGIHADTRDRVTALARELGYTVSQRRSGEESLRRHQVMVLSQCSAYATDRLYLAGISRAAIPLKIVLMAHHLPEEDCSQIATPGNMPTAMQEGTVDGLVLLHRWPTEVVAQLSARWPTVSIVHQYLDLPIDAVSTDDRSGMNAIVNHLVAAGHRRIGFFGFCRDVSWSCSRYAAFIEAIARAGLPYEPKDIVELTSGEALAYRNFADSPSFDKMLARLRDGVAAWACSSMGIAWSLVRMLIAQGIRVPEEVAVTGFHKNADNPPPDLPPLTSTAILDEDLGAAALRMLLHRFEYPRDAHRVMLLSAPLLVAPRQCH